MTASFTGSGMRVGLLELDTMVLTSTTSPPCPRARGEQTRVRRSRSAGRLPALAPGLLLLRGRTALRALAALAALLAATLGGALGVGDPGGSLLRHPLVLERFVLLLVL